eukprot:g10123.t1
MPTTRQTVFLLVQVELFLHMDCTETARQKAARTTWVIAVIAAAAAAILIAIVVAVVVCFPAVWILRVACMIQQQ